MEKNAVGAPYTNTNSTSRGGTWECAAHQKNAPFGYLSVNQ